MKYTVTTILLICVSLIMGNCTKYTPEKLGKKIGKTYCDSMTELAKLVKDKPDINAVKDKVYDHKEKTIKHMVEYGKIRESMSALDKERVDSVTKSELAKVNPDDFTAISDAVSHYGAIDNDFSNTIASFNAIIQYSSFELLKRQAPKEAERLGIK